MADDIVRGRFGTNACAERERRGMTQQQVQIRYNGNRDNNSYIAKLERLDAAPGRQVVEKLAAAIGCSVADLMVGVPQARMTSPVRQLAHTGRAGVGETLGRQEDTTMHDPLGGLRERYELIPKKRRLAAMKACEAILESFIQGGETGLRVARQKRG